MLRIARVGSVLGALLATGLIAGQLVLAQSIGPSASRVLGQPDVFGNDCPDPPSATTQCTSSGLAIEASGRLWVADADNHRVLSWPDAASFTNGQPADKVLGQPGFSSAECDDAPDASDLCYPQGVAVDSSGRLFVVDSDNSRVLSWGNAASVGNGAPADRVLGQSSFSGNECQEPATASTLCNPQNVAVDSSGRLWVSDGDNNRVLSWASASTISNGQPADKVLGQVDFSGSECAEVTTASTLCLPSGIAVDSSGRLWIADSDNNRVLSWPNAAAVANNEAADKVLGQPDFTTSECNVFGESASSLCTPIGLAVDSLGRLYVADSDNSRVLSWANAALSVSGANADLIYGQADAVGTDCTDPPSASTLCNPSGVVLDSARRLYVGDANNNRILAYDTPAP